jgi:hypothetical protein
MQAKNSTTTSHLPLRPGVDPSALIAALAQWLESVLINEDRGEQLGPAIDCWSDESSVYIEARGSQHEELHGDISFCGDRVFIRLAR